MNVVKKNFLTVTGGRRIDQPFFLDFSFFKIQTMDRLNTLYEVGYEIKKASNDCIIKKTFPVLHRDFKSCPKQGIPEIEEFVQHPYCNFHFSHIVNLFHYGLPSPEPHTHNTNIRREIKTMCNDASFKELYETLFFELTLDLAFELPPIQLYKHAINIHNDIEHFLCNKAYLLKYPYLYAAFTHSRVEDDSIDISDEIIYSPYI